MIDAGVGAGVGKRDLVGDTDVDIVDDTVCDTVGDNISGTVGDTVGDTDVDIVDKDPDTSAKHMGKRLEEESGVRNPQGEQRRGEELRDN